LFKNLISSFDVNSTRSNIAWAGILQLVEKGAGYVVLAVLTRTLLKEDLGMMFYAVSISELVAVILNFGTDTHLIRRVATNPEKGLVHLSHNLSIRFLAIVVGYVVLNLVVSLLMPEMTSVMLLVSAYNFLEEASRSFFSFFSGRKQLIYRLALMGGFRIFSMLVLAVIAFTTEMLIPVLWGYVGMSMILFVACYWVITRQFGKIDIKWEPQVSADILRASLPFFLVTLLNMMHMKFDTIMVGALLNVKQLADYQLGIKLVEVMRFMIRPLNMALLPVFSEYYVKQQWQKLRSRFWQLTAAMFLIGILLAVFMNFFGASAITLFFGAGYVASANPAKILFLSVPFLFVGLISNIVTNSIHLERKSVIVLALAVLVNISLNLFAIPQYGIIGAAWVTVISQTILTFGMLLLVLPKLKSLPAA
jgi:O-antigen/teichoic acid export membrane protein